MALTSESLISDPPRLHGISASGEHHDWALGTDALNVLERIVAPGWHTLETGAGVTTVLFALKQTWHTCIVPSREEIARIIAFCRDHGVSTERVTFVDQPSEEALPALDLEPLDLVLIDGSHSFPSVFIDWYYAARRLKQDGWLFVDDVQLWTARLLRDFLKAEDDWSLVEEIPFRTSIFRKRSADFQIRNWTNQPYVVSHSVFTRWERTKAMVREREWGLLAAKAEARLRRLVRRPDRER